MSKELRCLNTVQTKSGDHVKCGAFLIEVDKQFIKIRCRRCSTLWLVSRNELGKIVLARTQAEKDVIPKKEEDNV